MGAERGPSLPEGPRQPRPDQPAKRAVMNPMIAPAMHIIPMIAAIPPPTPSSNARPFRAATPAFHVERSMYAASARKTIPNAAAPAARQGDLRRVADRHHVAREGRSAPTMATARKTIPGVIRRRRRRDLTAALTHGPPAPNARW